MIDQEFGRDQHAVDGGLNPRLSGASCLKV
jgi:hypothetical protein